MTGIFSNATLALTAKAYLTSQFKANKEIKIAPIEEDVNLPIYCPDKLVGLVSGALDGQPGCNETKTE
jgi:hypothetical protein